MQPGHVERREFEYIRHGTKALIAAFDVATGQVRGTISDTRTEEDFVDFMKDLFASASPATPWRVVCDNLNTHMSEGVTRLVAEFCGIKEDLGEKGKSGHLNLETAVEICPFAEMSGETACCWEQPFHR